MDTWDAGGRKTKQVRDADVTTYTYDNANRLTGQEKSGERATFTYDAVGNMLLKWQEAGSPMTFTYSGFGQITTLQVSATRVTYTYDSDGNQTTEDWGGVVTGYIYDDADKMKRIDHSDGTKSTYTYSGDGLRRSVHEPSTTIKTMVWDNTDYLMEI